MKFHEEVKIYNSFTFLIFTSAILLFIGVFKREAFILGLSLISFLVIQYLTLKRSAESFFIRRSCPDKAREKELLNFTYTIDNRSSFTQKNVILIDCFSGSQQGLLRLAPSTPLKANSRTVLRHQLPADGGMGIHVIKDFKLSLSDSLGAFHIDIEETREDLIEIYPALEPIPELQYRFNTFSYHFGEKDIPHRGDSINFFGTRPFRPGDPIKTINWRMTAKHKETIANIYEKNINKSLTLLFNRDIRLHGGLGSQSTMEYLKDFLLAVASQNISNGNEVEVFSNQTNSPLGSGQGFINRLEFYLFNLDTIKDERAAHLITDTITRYQDWEAKERSLIYFTPIVPGPLFEKNMEDLIGLKQHGKEVEVVFVNAFPFLDKRLKFGGPISVKHQLAIVLEREKYWQKMCREKDIPCYSISINPHESFPHHIQKARSLMWKT